MRKIYIAETPVESHLIKGLFESKGISVIVSGEDIARIIGVNNWGQSEIKSLKRSVQIRILVWTFQAVFFCA